MDRKFYSKVCCNPFKKVPHKPSARQLRNVLPWMIERIPTLRRSWKVCCSCRLAISKMSAPERQDVEIEENVEDELCPEEASGTEGDDSPVIDIDAAIEGLNQCLINLGESSIERKRMTDVSYRRRKLQEVKSAISQKIFHMAFEEEPVTVGTVESEILNRLKEKCVETLDADSKQLIIDVLPKSWSIERIRKEFPNVSYHLIKRSKQKKEAPFTRQRKGLDQTIVESIRDFYSSDDISRIMPGKKDVVSVKVDGKRTHMQKRLILCNLRELYATFKERHPDMKVGFSKFASLRPKHCVLAGSSGTHSVCVCTIHQNVVLMLEAAKIPHLTANSNTPLQNYKDCLNMGICNPPSNDCYLQECIRCPGFEQLRVALDNIFEGNNTQEISYKQWTTTDRSTLETRTEPTEEFIDIFVDKITKLLRHSFIAEQQSAYLRGLKRTLQPGEYIILCDFAENYSFVLQDEAQSFHWNNAQATIHPFVIYFKDDPEQTIKSRNYVVISDCKKHDTILVHLFQRYLINFMKQNFQTMKRVFYFSDGSAAQYKNRKNFINLLCHQQDFGFSAEWHFFATSHGKGPCDGIGGTVKRLAAKASLQRPYHDQIMTPRQLYEWARCHIQNIDFSYVPSAEYDAEENLLSDRFAQACKIPGTQQLHSFQPTGKYSLQTRIFSTSPHKTIHHIFRKYKSSYKPQKISGFVTFTMDSSWHLGCVLSEEEGHFKIITLERRENLQFFFPKQPRIAILDTVSVLLKVDPSSDGAGSYSLTEEEEERTIAELHKYNMEVLEHS